MNSGTIYAESVASCRPPTPLCSPSRASAAVVPDAPRLPVRRHLDFPGGGDLDDDDDDFLYRAAEVMERSLYDSQRLVADGLTAVPPPLPFPEKQCICGRGPCDVVWQVPGHWAYVCSAPPKCKHSARCEESDHDPNSEPAFWSHPEPNDHHVFNTPSNHRACATTRVNVSPQGVYATVPVNVCPQGADATTPVNFSPQGAGAATPVNIATGARSNGEWPTCKCTAGKCKISKVKGVEYYVCPIPKGQGACAHRELVNAGAEESPQTRNNNPMESKHLEYNPVMKDATGHKMVKTGKNNENRPVNLDQPEDDEWQFDIVDNDIVDLTPARPSPGTAVAQLSSMLHQPIAMAGLETSSKSPVPSKFTISPTTPRSGSCFLCHEEGHWAINCPKKNVCFHCGVAGHWKTACPELHNKRGF